MIYKNLYKLSIIFLFIISLNTVSYAQNIKVACIGDSVTYGAGIEDRDKNSYPAQLQELLGVNYEVKNFGFSGATMLKNGHKPYWEKAVFENSKNFQPNIVIIHLGLNDQGNNNWPKHKDEFIDDYLELISVYKSLPTNPKVIICRMSPTLSGHHWFEEGMRESFKEIQQKIEKISIIAQVDLIDLHEPLYRFPEYLPDNLHPTKEGVAFIAKKVFGAITGKFGGLQLSKLYGEKMVLQRNEPINISGTSDFKDVIKVTLKDKSLSTKVSKDGKWKVTFPRLKAGGPFKLTIESKNSNKFNFKEVYIGEVWLASGQSNMDFMVKQMANSKTVLSDSLNSNIFMFSMDGKVLSSKIFDESELKECNASNYYNYSGWNNNKELFESFSAVAYFYAQNLQKELNVPIGIICNAIGGSPIQSWISREQLELQPETVAILNDTHMNPRVHPWVSERIALNLKNIRKTKVKARHPYEPTMLFDAGINPLKNYNIKGVIWYQGESNAERPDLHTKLFKMLVQDWRDHWKKPEMPFYFVQLSSINRPTWGTFRDSQRRLLEIPFTGMAVSSDVGHKTDVHPKKKWIVGERLSKISLFKNYNFTNAFSGPILDYVNVKNNRLEVSFKHGEGLQTSSGEEVSDVQIANSSKVFVKAKARIINNKLEIWSKEVRNPRYVKYGYTPFTTGNLINKYGLPASTFSNLKK